jgi:hypothetical protein
MDVFTVLDNIERLRKCSVMNAFNNTVRQLRRQLRGGIFALDSTIIETKADFPGCGKTKRKKEGHSGDLPSDYEYIYGFKLFMLYEVQSRIIVAMYIVPANEDDHKYFLPVIKQGIHNCGSVRIQVVIADRGFLDGAQLWELKHRMKVDFIIPAKAGMIIREDAIGLRKKYNNRLLAEWKYGKGKCQGYGVDGLRSYIEYNPGDAKNNRKTNGSPLNAVVVTTWRGKAVPPEKQKVMLTSLPTEEDAASIVKKYRLRSLIENGGFRELKQAAYLKHLPGRKGKNAENAAYLHIMLCVFAYTLFYAFLGWRKNKAPEQSAGDCLREWRRRESIREDRKILVVAEEKYYALFKLSEILDILGVKQRYTVEMNC